MAKQRLILRVLGVLLLIVSTRAMAWWNDAWPYRLPITLNTTATGANIKTDIQGATVLVKLHSGNFQDFFLVNQDLSDVRFLAADDKTPLDFQIESYDLINQLIYIWVKIPKVSANLNTERIWMYYGNTKAKPLTKITPPYNSKVAAVYHFNNLQSAANDSSGHAYNITLANGKPAPSSMIAGGIRFDGAGGIQTSIISQLSDIAHTGMTLSFWLKPDASASRSTVISLGGSENPLKVMLDQNQLFLSANAGALESKHTPAIKAGDWHHIAVTFSNGALQMYLDGSPAAHLDGVSVPASPVLAIGADLSNAEPFTGTLDELRVDAAARTEDDIRLQLASQSLMGNLLNFQQAEQLGSGGGSSSFWTVIIGSTEVTGWTIISLLAAMAAISWMVMVGKALYIRSVGRDDFAFLEQYRIHAGEDPALLDHAETQEDRDLEDSPILQAVFGDHDHFQSSPMYRVYHRGIEEVRSRIGTSVGARAAGLSQSAVSAIRAAIDAQMVREARRLNSKMVLLTIAISGGPFLGLMGTVIGVMLTFAAIAASGDVNISAIAPGVAAALLTTVSGLVVAIPALFGYNYLATRIKESISEMRVFADEFVTRLAEYYSH